MLLEQQDCEGDSLLLLSGSRSPGLEQTVFPCDLISPINLPTLGICSSTAYENVDRQNLNRVVRTLECINLLKRRIPVSEMHQ